MQNIQQGSNSVMQRTLRSSICYVGIGLHSGHKVSMRVRPAEANTGISFIRKDVPQGQGLVLPRWYNVVDTQMCSVIGNEYGTTISTVEHLMAALSGCGVDNAIVELDGPEVPIMDGSSGPFVSLIERVGTVDQPAERRVIWIQRPLAVRMGEKFALLMPADSPRITVSISFPGSAVRSQTLSVELVNEAFRRDVARARTFGFADQIERLRENGLIKGGSLRNAVLVDGERIVNEEGLRFDDEFVRHKILDCMGDLALAGVPIIGHLYTYKPGHELNNALMHKLFDSVSAWSYMGYSEWQRLLGQRQSVLEHVELEVDEHESLASS